MNQTIRKYLLFTRDILDEILAIITGTNTSRTIYVCRKCQGNVGHVRYQLPSKGIVTKFQCRSCGWKSYWYEYAITKKKADMLARKG